MIFFVKIKNGEKKWMVLKDRKCILPAKGIIEIEATLIYTDVKTFFFILNSVFFGILVKSNYSNI
jgi:hypothetical protein